MLHGENYIDVNCQTGSLAQQQSADVSSNPDKNRKKTHFLQCLLQGHIWRRGSAACSVDALRLRLWTAKYSYFYEYIIETAVALFRDLIAHLAMRRRRNQQRRKREWNFVDISRLP